MEDDLKDITHHVQSLGMLAKVDDEMSSVVIFNRNPAIYPWHTSFIGVPIPVKEFKWSG